MKIGGIYIYPLNLTLSFSFNPIYNARFSLQLERALFRITTLYLSQSLIPSKKAYNQPLSSLISLSRPHRSSSLLRHSHHKLRSDLLSPSISSRPLLSPSQKPLVTKRSPSSCRLLSVFNCRHQAQSRASRESRHQADFFRQTCHLHHSISSKPRDLCHQVDLSRQARHLHLSPFRQASCTSSRHSSHHWWQLPFIHMTTSSSQSLSFLPFIKYSTLQTPHVHQFPISDSFRPHFLLFLHFL